MGSSAEESLLAKVEADYSEGCRIPMDQLLVKTGDGYRIAAGLSSDRFKKGPKKLKAGRMRRILVHMLETYISSWWFEM